MGFFKEIVADAAGLVAKANNAIQDKQREYAATEAAKISIKVPSPHKAIEALVQDRDKVEKLFKGLDSEKYKMEFVDVTIEDIVSGKYNELLKAALKQTTDILTK